MEQKQPLLSILMPAIRPERWDSLFNSIVGSLESGTNFELILVSPNRLPEHLVGLVNIKYITDFGSPTRCFNIALEVAEGKYVTWGADDGTYLPGALKRVLERLESVNDEKQVIALTQMEDQHVYDKEFCRINKHAQLSSPHIKDDYVLFPTAVMHTKFMQEVGGLDCQFQGHAMAHIDFAIRAQTLGAKVEFEPHLCLKLTHMMGPSGDHGPIHYSQLQEDEPRFRQVYSVDNTERIHKLATPSFIQNWKEQEDVWHWRFKRGDNLRPQSDNPVNKYDITVFLGGIRPFLWENLYKSIAASLPRHSFQLIIAGYQPPTKEFSDKNYPNFKFIKDFGGPSRGAQLASIFAESELITLGADDATYRPGILSDAIDNFYKWEKESGKKDFVLGVKYGEGGNLMGDHYWTAWHHPPLQLIGIPRNAPMVLNTIMKRKFFEECGGYDCKTFSTCNWGGHDLYQKLITQYDIGFKFHPQHVMECTWSVEAAGVNNDHAPVAEADHYQYPKSDYVAFREKYIQFEPNAKSKNIKHSWKDAERVWSKRFSIEVKEGQ
jgi:hypothetical protein